jgi:hypothetical protein
VPDAKLVVVVRDPIEPAHSNWMHLWSDGLEPVADFRAACELEDRRIAAGWGPFWHYRRTGLYGEQLEHLFTQFPREQVHVLRYRDLVHEPRRSLDGICAFLGVDPDPSLEVRGENTRPFVRPGPQTSVVAPVVRMGASLGRHFPPEVWRQASVPLLWALHADGAPRPVLPRETRLELVDYFRDDVRRLSAITGRRLHRLARRQGAGEYSVRRSWAPPVRVTS